MTRIVGHKRWWQWPQEIDINYAEKNQIKFYWKNIF